MTASGLHSDQHFSDIVTAFERLILLRFIKADISWAVFFSGHARNISTSESVVAHKKTRRD
jgi:hypothetical protein